MIDTVRNWQRFVACATTFALLLSLSFSEDALPAHASPLTENATIPTNGTTIYAPLVFHRAFTAREQTMFGVQMYGYTGYNRPAYQALLDSGATWVRNELPWRSVEPTNREPEDYNWRAVEQVVAAATDAKFHILLTFNYAPEWAADDTNGPINSANIDDFVQYVGAVVERLDGDGIDDLPGSPVVNHFQFYNEPDRRPDPEDTRSGWGYAPEAYADMLKAVAPAIRDANPRAKIVFGGLAYDWFEDQGGPYVRGFLDGVLAEDVGDSFDIFAYHVYPPFAANWTQHGSGLYEKTEFIRNRLAQFGLNKPLMISEAGMHSNDADYPMTAELQARYVIQLFAESIAAGVEMMIWFSFEDPPAWYPYENGLITSANPPVKKLSYATYQRTVEILTGVESDAVLDAGVTGAENMKAYRFQADDGRTVYVAWLTPVDVAGAADLIVPGNQVTVTTTHGQTSLITDNDDGSIDGMVTVTVTAQPIFVEVND